MPDVNKTASRNQIVSLKTVLSIFCDVFWSTSMEKKKTYFEGAPTVLFWGFVSTGRFRFNVQVEAAVWQTLGDETLERPNSCVANFYAHGMESVEIWRLKFGVTPLWP